MERKDKMKLFIRLIALIVLFIPSIAFSDIFIDDFSNQSFTQNNWFVEFGEWEVGNGYYMGSYADTGPPIYPPAYSGLTTSYYNEGLFIESIFSVNSYYGGGVMFSGNIFPEASPGVKDYNGTFSMISVEDSYLFVRDYNGQSIFTTLAVIHTPQLYYNTPYLMRVIYTNSDLFNVFLFGQDDTGFGNELAAIYGLQSSLQNNYGLAGVLSAYEGVSFDQFYLSGTPIIPSVPEPTTMLLLGTGLIGLAGVRRKRK